MPTPANPTIGRVKCPFSGEQADVKRDKHKRLYYSSAAGRIFPTGSAGQEWMLENATLYGAGGPPQADPPVIQAPPPKPDPAPVIQAPVVKPASAAKPAPVAKPAAVPETKPAPVVQAPRKSMLTLLG